MRNPILVALDVPTAEAALELAAKVAPAVGGFKVGSELFTAAGPALVRELRATGAHVFLDLKFHDIPNTVAGACRAAAKLGAWTLVILFSRRQENVRVIYCMVSKMHQMKRERNSW